MKIYYVYILTNSYNTVLYTGVTKDLKKRISDHKNKINPKSFSARYNLTKLVYYESFQSITHAIAREKQIKAGPRKKKIKLIESINDKWEDLYFDLCLT